MERLHASTPISRILVKPGKKLPPEVSAITRDYCIIFSCALYLAAMDVTGDVSATNPVHILSFTLDNISAKPSLQTFDI